MRTPVEVIHVDGRERALGVRRQESPFALKAGVSIGAGQMLAGDETRESGSVLTRFPPANGSSVDIAGGIARVAGAVAPFVAPI
jgi:hypothetical protein